MSSASKNQKHLYPFPRLFTHETDDAQPSYHVVEGSWEGDEQTLAAP